MKEEADLIITNGKVYTINENFSIGEAFAVKDGRILDVGTVQEISRKFTSDHMMDLDGKFVYPGWIDAHCHFYGYGLTLNEVNLVGMTSPEEVIKALEEFQKTNRGTWLTGRGWDQNDWKVKDFPTRWMLDEYFPDQPVFLKRIDGHAAWVNTRALDLAGITVSSGVEGGDVIIKDGKVTGILVDNAINLVSDLIPPPTAAEIESALITAQENCFAVGLTSVHDAGLDRGTINMIDSLHKQGKLKMRINAMLNPTGENITTYVLNGPFRNDHLSIGTIKLYADGALGSRGALMIEPYADDPSNSGLLLTPMDDLRKYCTLAYDNNFQVATHCIGDGGNRIMLNMYAELLKGKNDRRWRIEHAQVIHPADIPLYGDFNIVPSIQSTHATSDMYWAEERLGPERMEGAYAYKKLLEQNGWIPNGSDFPVEDINPLYGFYASVVRKDFKGYPERGFLFDNALTREEALKSMTIWAAKSAFEEEFKGSLEPGKLADFVITGRDIMTAPEEELYKIKVFATFSGGERVY